MNEYHKRNVTLRRDELGNALGFLQDRYGIADYVLDLARAVAREEASLLLAESTSAPEATTDTPEEKSQESASESLSGGGCVWGPLDPYCSSYHHHLARCATHDQIEDGRLKYDEPCRIGKLLEALGL